MNGNITTWGKDYSRLLKDLQSRKISTVWVESTIWIILEILTIFGNGLTLKIIMCNTSQRTVDYNYLIASLAIADFGMGTAGSPLCFGVLITSKWPYNETTCQYQGVISLTRVYTPSPHVKMRHVKSFYSVDNKCDLNNYHHEITRIHFSLGLTLDLRQRFLK